MTKQELLDKWEDLVDQDEMGRDLDSLTERILTARNKELERERDLLAEDSWNRANERDRALEAGDALYESVGGHDHWDKTGGAGSGCPVCIRQREGRDAWRKLRDSLRPPVVMSSQDREAVLQLLLEEQAGWMWDDRKSAVEALIDATRDGIRGLSSYSDDELLDALTEAEDLDDGRNVLLAKYRGEEKL